MSLFLHSYQYNNKPWIDSCADLLLTPWRVFLGGKKVEFVQLVSQNIPNEEPNPKKRSVVMDFIQGRDPFQQGIQNEKYEKRSTEAWYWWIGSLAVAALLVVKTHTLFLKVVGCVTLLGIAFKVLTFILYSRFRNIHCQPSTVINVEERDIKDVVIILEGPECIKDRIQSRYSDGVKIHRIGRQATQEVINQLPTDADVFLLRELQGGGEGFWGTDGYFGTAVADLCRKKFEKKKIRCGVWLTIPLIGRRKRPPYSMEELQKKFCLTMHEDHMEQIIL